MNENLKTLAAVHTHTHTGSLLENEKTIKLGVILLSKRYLNANNLY